MENKKIDPEKEGIGITGATMRTGKTSPSAMLNGKELYRRLFIRLRTPQETLTCSPIENGKDFARRASIIENWFNSVIRHGNYILTFYAEQVTDEIAEQMELKSIEYGQETDRKDSTKNS